MEREKWSTRASGEKVITPHLDSVLGIYVCLWGQQKISVGRQLERLCMKMRIKTRKRTETYLFRFFQYASDNNCRYRNLTAVVFHHDGAREAISLQIEKVLWGREVMERKPPIYFESRSTKNILYNAI